MWRLSVSCNSVLQHRTNSSSSTRGFAAALEAPAAPRAASNICLEFGMSPL